MSYAINKTWILLLIALAAGFGGTAILQPAHAQEPITAPAADIFAGETLYYTIDFWLLRGSATGELCFDKTPNGYRALFEAETKGVLRLVAGHRKEIMESVMEYDQEKKRLRPKLFRETFLQNKMVYKREITFDYEKGSFTCIRSHPRGRPRCQTVISKICSPYFTTSAWAATDPCGTVPGSKCRSS
jgi:hypothetical protein